MPRRKLPTPPRLSNTGYVDRWPWRHTHQTLGELNVCVWSPGWSGDLHSQPRAVLQEVLRFHRHYPVLVFRSGSEGPQRLVGNGEQVGEKWRKTPRGAVAVLIPLSFIYSPSSSLRFSVERHTAATKESIICLHLTSPFFMCYFGR